MKRKQRSKNFSAGVMLCLTALCTSAALAQGRFPAVDGALIPADRLPPQRLAKLVGPDVLAQHFDLPPTVIPAGALLPTEWGPRQIGYVEGPPAGVQSSGAWQTQLDGGAILRLEFASPNAKGLRLQLRGELNGLELRVYEPGGKAVFGPYSALSGVWEEGEEPSWWTPTIDGESIGLEFYQRSGFPPPLPELAAISYIYDDLQDEYEPLGGGCILDSTCYPPWNSETHAVGRMAFIDVGGSFVCTGAMMNRNPSDLAPIFMTARHCIHNQPAANSLEIRWLYQSDLCDGPVPSLATRPRNNGALMLKINQESDWSLLGLFEQPNTDYFLGWDPNYWDDSSPGTGISHPSGRPKKIHFGTKDGNTSCHTADHAVDSGSQWHFSETQGAPRRGSSGSPVFDAGHRVRGALSCGPGGDPEPLTCPPDTFSTYGRLDAAYPVVRWYLFQMASPAYADWNYIGDPGQDGDRERGTLTNPFTTVYKASFAVRSGDQILLQPGTYHEGGPITLLRPMTLRTRGGLVTITR